MFVSEPRRMLICGLGVGDLVGDFGFSWLEGRFFRERMSDF